MGIRRGASLLSFGLVALLVVVSSNVNAESAEVVPDELVFEDSTNVQSDVLGFHSHAVPEGQIARLYKAYFGREPDETGLNYWLRANVQGHHLEEISDFFAQSEEFVSLYGSVSNDEFVTLLYRNVLNREPDESGLSYWRAVLNDGFTPVSYTHLTLPTILRV